MRLDRFRRLLGAAEAVQGGLVLGHECWGARELPQPYALVATAHFLSYVEPNVAVPINFLGQKRKVEFHVSASCAVPPWIGGLFILPVFGQFGKRFL
jgi:hypothetical protein